MSILVKSEDQYFEIDEGDLARCAISDAELDARSDSGDVADRNLLSEVYSEAVQIGCGCCTSKKSYGASC